MTRNLMGGMLCENLYIGHSLTLNALRRIKVNLANARGGGGGGGGGSGGK